MVKSDASAYKYALISVFLWSTVATAFKYSLQYLSPEQLVLYASLTSLIVLFKAYDLLPAQEAQAINYTWALMLAYLSVPFLKQKLRFVDIVAGIICYFGVLIISTKGEPFSLNFSNIDGVLLALLSTVLWALYWIFNTKSKADSVVSLFCNFLFATPLIIVYCLVTQPIVFPETTGLLGAIYVGLFEMGITFLFWLKAMQNAENTSKIANLIFISPFVSLIFIYFILGEKIYMSTLFGLGFIIVGLVFQTSKRFSKKEVGQQEKAY